MAIQQTDLVTPFKKSYQLFSTEAFSAEIGSAFQSFVTKTANSIMKVFSNLILNFPTIFLRFW
jgi:hypothetical protein